jgi:anthranilate synthase component II
MLLVLDNYDSFTWNLVQLLGELGADPVVLRNDEITVDRLVADPPERLVVSPGPCTPTEAGVSVAALRTLVPMGVPVLGVCLGHQALGEAFGGRTIRAGRLMHGKVDAIEHTGAGIFQGLPSPFRVTRYHSLVTDPAVLPPVFEAVAWSAASSDGATGREVQAMRHRELPAWGLQFHPESLFSEHGRALLGAFLAIPAARPTPD